MATKTLVSMNKQGRLTVPVEARRALHVEGEAQFEVEVTENALILRPVVAIPREDAWFYTPENRRLLEQALKDAREGRIFQLTEADLERLIGE
jgi:bifunctional DNA-binding transcriptional regulator/antitoxin component of YhaV-PrlF toxin-antitoxin module